MIKLSNINKTCSRFVFYFALLNTIFFSVFFRVYRLNHTFNFFFDVARDYDISRQILVNKKLTLLGPPTSFGQWSQRETYFGPLHYYLIGLAFLLSGMDPLSPVILTGLLNLASGVILFILILKIFKSRYLALGVCAFYLLSPLSVIYSRFSWNPNCIPFFVGVSIFCLYEYSLKKQGYILFLSAFFAGLAFQLHYVVFPYFIAVLFLIYFLNQTFKEKILSAFYFFSGSVVGVFPLVLFELRHNFFLTKSLIFQFSSKNSIQFSFNIKNLVNYWFSLIGRSVGIFESFPAAIIGIFFSLVLIFFAFYYLFFKRNLALLSCKRIFFDSANVSKKEYTDKTKFFPYFLLVFNFMEIIFASLWGNLAGSRIEDRYLLPAIFPFFLLIGFYIDFLMRFFRKKPFVFLPFLVAVLITMILKDILIVKEEIGIDDRHVNFLGALKIAQIISEDVKENNLQGKFNVANIVDGNSRATYYRFFLNKDRLAPLSVESYPQSEVLYVISKQNAEDTMKDSVWEIDSFNPKTVLSQWSGPFGTKIYKLAH